MPTPAGLVVDFAGFAASPTREHAQGAPARAMDRVQDLRDDAVDPPTQATTNPSLQGPPPMEAMHNPVQ